ncbi:helix-turn-helix domain-containing protein [Streptomyces sp. NBC_00656]|uniref:PucR family transcriptional regulator n=1 Tax=Streptomyces sp. NBC_00656 TaxID=2903668 RepID=UPI003254FA36
MNHAGEGGPTAEDEAARALVRAAALRLRPRVSELTARVVARLTADMPEFPGWAPGAAESETESLRTLVRLHLDQLVDATAGEAAARYLRERARLRAKQGTPLPVVAHVMTVGVAVFWEELVDTVVEHWPGQVPLMLHLAREMRGFRERTSAILAGAYADELGGSAGMAVAGASLLSVLLAAPPDELTVGATAAALGVPRRGRYVVAAMSGRAGWQSLGGTASVLGPGSRVLREHRSGGGEFLVVMLGQGPLRAVADLLRGLPGSRTGVSPVVSGLAELHRARLLADTALSTCRGDGEVALWEERIPAVVAAADPGLAKLLADAVLGPLLRLPGDERRSVLRTLELWLECSGSTTATAERLCCHRNTVLNRLRRLEELTDRQLNKPRDVVDLALALHIHRRGGGSA